MDLPSTFLWSFVHDPLANLSNEDTVLQDFCNNYEAPVSELLQNLEEMFSSITRTVMLSAHSNIQ